MGLIANKVFGFDWGNAEVDELADEGKLLTFSGSCDSKMDEFYGLQSSWRF